MFVISGQIFVIIAKNTGALHIQICAFGVAFDKALARGNLVAHEHVEDFVGFNSFLNRDFEDGAVGGIHSGIPEGFGVHFAKAFVAADLGFFATVGGLVFVDEPVTLFVAVDVLHLFARFDVVEWGLG